MNLGHLKALIHAAEASGLTDEARVVHLEGSRVVETTGAHLAHVVPSTSIFGGEGSLLEHERRPGDFSSSDLERVFYVGKQF